MSRRVAKPNVSRMVRPPELAERYGVSVKKVLGFINAFSDRYLSANWTNAIVFGVLIAILVFKPTGLLGQQLAERS